MKSQSHLSLIFGHKGRCLVGCSHVVTARKERARNDAPSDLRGVQPCDDENLYQGGGCVFVYVCVRVGKCDRKGELGCLVVTISRSGGGLSQHIITHISRRKIDLKENRRKEKGESRKGMVVMLVRRG